MALELLPIRIRANKMVEGIQIKNITTKMGIYVYDVVCYLRNPVTSCDQYLAMKLGGKAQDKPGLYLPSRSVLIKLLFMCPEFFQIVHST